MNRNVREELQGIYDKHGDLRPTVIVRQAADPESPLHSCFEWDESRAAHEYRLHQARKMLAKFKIVTENGEERLVHVPRIRLDGEPEGEGKYRAMSAVLRVEDERARSLRELLRMVRGLNERVSPFVLAWSDDEDTAKVLRELDDAARKAEAKLESLV